MRLIYANCFIPPGVHGDALFTDEVAVADSAPTGIEVMLTDRAVDPAAAEACNLAMMRLAFEWFQLDGEDPTMVGGISAGDLAGPEVATALLIPAARAVLGVSAVISEEPVERMTIVTPGVGGSRYRAVETLQCEAAAATIEARNGERVDVERSTSAEPANRSLIQKYVQTRDPAPLTASSRWAHWRQAGPARFINLASATRGPRRSESLLVYEYGPTHAFADGYSRVRSGRMRLCRCRTPRRELLTIPHRGDRLIVPAPVSLKRASDDRIELEEMLCVYEEAFTGMFHLAGVNLWALLREPLLATVAKYRAFARAGEAYWRLKFRQNRVKALLVPFDGPPEVRLMMRVAQASGIPVFGLNDGFKGDDFSFEGMSTDYAMAWSKSIADNHYRRHASGKAQTTGNPRSDIPRPPRVRATSTREIGRILVGTFTFSPVDLNCRRSDPEAFMAAVLDGILASETARRAEIVIKLHPADRVDHYLSTISRFGDLRISIVDQGDITEMFDDADLHVTTYSTSLLEAVARDLPVIYYRVNHQRLHAPFTGDSLLEKRTADSPQELTRLLNQPLIYALPPSGIREAWVEQYLGPVDGRTVERIEQAIRSRL